MKHLRMGSLHPEALNRESIETSEGTGTLRVIQYTFEIESDFP